MKMCKKKVLRLQHQYVGIISMHILAFPTMNLEFDISFATKLLERYVIMDILNSKGISNINMRIINKIFND